MSTPRFLYEKGEEAVTIEVDLLDARGAVSVTERVKLIAQVRTLVTEIARRFVRDGAV